MTQDHLFVHSSGGLQLREGPPDYAENPDCFSFYGTIRKISVSPTGNRVAWITGGEVCIAEKPEWKRVATFEHPKAQDISFSPQGSYLSVWDIIMKDEDGKLSPNLNIYDMSTKTPVKAIYQQSQMNWEPLWSKDEAIMARCEQSELMFFRTTDFETPENKQTIPNIKGFSLSPSNASALHFTCFIPEVKSNPATVHLYAYPCFKDVRDARAGKALFKIDTVENIWNPCGKSVLVLIIQTPDPASSYYGEEMLFYFNTKGDSIRIAFGTKGNARAACWCPSGKEFFVIHGAMPTKATLFNEKCDRVAEFGEGARNLVMVNPVGNIVMVGGMGNISSRIEFWDITEAKLLGKQECPDITHMEWSPCGQYLLTATCSPRLRVNNCYRIWHYTATLQHEFLAENEDIYRATWLPFSQPPEPFKITGKPVKGIEATVKAASKERYIPPQRRAIPGTSASVDTAKKFLSQREDLLASSTKGESKQSSKNAKKRAAAWKKKEEAKGMNMDWRKGVEVGKGELPQDDKGSERAEVITPAGSGEAEPNKAKKIKNLEKKLQEIKKLKSDQNKGKELDINQEKKIATENDIIQQLNQLKLT